MDVTKRSAQVSAVGVMGVSSGAALASLAMQPFGGRFASSKQLILIGLPVAAFGGIGGASMGRDAANKDPKRALAMAGAGAAFAGLGGVAGAMQGLEWWASHSAAHPNIPKWRYIGSATLPFLGSAGFAGAMLGAMVVDQIRGEKT